MSVKPELSRLVAIEGISTDRARAEVITATEAECVALAERFEIRTLENVKATINIRRVAGGTAVKLVGDIEADVVQSCVISLADVHDHIKAHFETFFTENVEDVTDDIEFSPDDDDPPEMVQNGQIDLGEVVAQYLSLEIDPYPKAPGVSLPAQHTEVGAEVKNNPFAVLGALKDKTDK